MSEFEPRWRVVRREDQGWRQYRHARISDMGPGWIRIVDWDNADRVGVTLPLTMLVSIDREAEPDA